MKDKKWVTMLGTLVFGLVFLAVPSENVGYALNPAVNCAAGVRPRSVAVGGFDGDGNLDVAVANPDSTDVLILLGNREAHPPCRRQPMPRETSSTLLPCEISTGELS